MSAFFLSVNRDQTPFDATVADQMMRSIDRFGHDTKRLIVKDNYAIAYQSLWTVPEEQGETQPLLTKQNNCWTCFYGRIDNRDELAALLKNTIDSNASDAQLFCDYFEQFGAKGLKAIIGPFAFGLAMNIFILRPMSSQSLNIRAWVTSLIKSELLEWLWAHKKCNRLARLAISNRLSRVNI